MSCWLYGVEMNSWCACTVLRGILKKKKLWILVVFERKSFLWSFENTCWMFFMGICFVSLNWWWKGNRKLSVDVELSFELTEISILIALLVENSMENLVIGIFFGLSCFWIRIKWLNRFWTLKPIRRTETIEILTKNQNYSLKLLKFIKNPQIFKSKTAHVIDWSILTFTGHTTLWKHKFPWNAHWTGKNFIEIFFGGGKIKQILIQIKN